MGVSQESIPEFNEYNNDFLKTKQNGEQSAGGSGAVDNKSIEVDKKSVESKKSKSSNLKVPEQKGTKQVAKRNSQKLAPSPKNSKGKPSPTAKGKNAQKGKNKSNADDGMVKARDDE